MYTTRLASNEIF